MNEDNKRYKRVARMKKIIFYGRIIIVLIPIVLCIILFIKVGSVENQLDNVVKLLNDKGKLSSEVIGELTETIENSEPNKVYLTFDDGPSEATDRVLDILAKYNVKATFFVVGKTGQEDLARYRRIVDEGHTIGLHTYSHDYEKVYSSVDKFSADLLKLRQLIKETTGVDTYYVRFPGGSSSEKLKSGEVGDYIKYLNDNGYIYFDWNVAGGDASADITTEEIVTNVLKDVGKYGDDATILLHSFGNKTTTTDALPVIIEKLLDMGYEFKAIDDSTVPVQHRILD